MARVRARRADIAPERDESLRNYFLGDIPRRLHLRVGAGGLDPYMCVQWMDYARRHAYEVRLWDLGDEGQLRDLLPETMRPAWTLLREASRHRAVGDLVGYAALAAEGGVLVGEHLRPPRAGGESAPWHELVPMHGLVLSPLARARDIGKHEAIFVGLDLVMSSPGHPSLSHILTTLAGNISEGTIRGPGEMQDSYLTGAAVFNRTLGGVYILLPRRTLFSYQALVPQKDEDHRTLHRARGGSAGMDQELPDPLDAWEDPYANLCPEELDPLPSTVGVRYGTIDDTWAPVPRLIHQIWFGDPTKHPREKTLQWEDWARQVGYTYRLWGEDDLAEISGLMPPENRRVFDEVRQRRVWPSASDVLRLSILETSGGIYVDCDHTPPRAEDGSYVDFANLCPMRGLTLMTEPYAREVGADSFFAGNSMIFSPPRHGLVQRAVRHLPYHFDTFLSSRGAIDPWRSTGPMLITRLLDSPLSVWPINLRYQYNMYDDKDAHPAPELIKGRSMSP